MKTVLVNDENDEDTLDGPFIAVSMALIVGSVVLAAIVTVASRTHYCGENNPYGLGSTVGDACSVFGDFGGVYLPVLGPPLLVAVGGVLAAGRGRWRPLLIGLGLALLLMAIPVFVLVIASAM